MNTILKLLKEAASDAGLEASCASKQSERTGSAAEDRAVKMYAALQHKIDEVIKFAEVVAKELSVSGASSQAR